jgi:hypothetical protein
MSSKKQISNAFILELAKDRGIFYSTKSSREVLASQLSLLPHDYHDIQVILDQREHAGRAEKITSIILNTPLDINEINEAAKEYKEQSQSDENVITSQNGNDKLNVTVHYSDIDYSKNRLVQRRPKEANIEFIVEGDKTIVRMPANERAKNIVENIKNHIDAKKKTDITIGLVELSMFSDPVKRTSFFTQLITNLPGFKLENVTSVKVESDIKDTDEESQEYEEDQDNNEQIEGKVLALVKNVALKGRSLLVSPEYKQLKDRCFFITSIIWQSKKLEGTLPIIEFEAGFEEPESCKGFKYNVRGAYHYRNGTYTKTPRLVSDSEKEQYFSIIEQTSRNILAELIKIDTVSDDLPNGDT